MTLRAVRTPSEPDRETEEKILDAAHVVFLRLGTSGARMKDIAEEAGVNQALLHYYFRNKAGLAEAVFKRAFGGFFPTLAGILGSDATIAEKIRAVVEKETDFLLENPYLPGFVLSELQHQPERLRHMSARIGQLPAARLGKQLAAEAAAGRIRRIAPEQFIINLVAQIVYPFIAKPLVDGFLGVTGQDFAAFIAVRRRELPEIILNSLRP
jgi:TetR/AcrR family transcriptional regulator